MQLEVRPHDPGIVLGHLSDEGPNALDEVIGVAFGTPLSRASSENAASITGL